MTTLIEPKTVRDFLNGQLRQLPDITRLPGHNQNFLLTTGDQRMILKLSSTEGSDESDRLLRLEDDIIAHLSGKRLELALPARIELPDTDNGPGILVHQNQQYRGRLLHYIDGPTWAEQPVASRHRLQHLGRILAEINMSLSDLELAAARRTHIWDMNRGDQHRDCCRHFRNLQDRRVIEWGYQYFTAVALPLLPGLPHSIIHGDANEENIIVDGDRVTGLIDFGDALYNPAVCDLAIAVTYVMMAEREPFEAAADRHRRISPHARTVRK